MGITITLSEALKLDGKDPLRSYREKFVIEDDHVIYLDGNSLGRLPKVTQAHLNTVIETQWGKDLIDSWNKNWFSKSREIGKKIARLIGAEEEEVIIADSTSINLYKLAFAALTYQKDRTGIITDRYNFPTDQYILQGLLNHHFHDHQIDYLGGTDRLAVTNEEFESHLSSNTALLLLSHVLYKSAYMYDMESITRQAHDHGAMMLWDLSHSVGAVPVHLKKSNVDLAVGCTYKYLNGGPGSPAFLYVRQDLQKKLNSPIWGWFADAQPFDFSMQFVPSNDLGKFLVGTPPVLSQLGVEHGVDLVLDAKMDHLRDKSVKLTEYFIKGWRNELQPLGFKLESPEDFRCRGSHVALSHQYSDRITKALMDPEIDGRKDIPDFRAPDIIRFGIAPMYNTFEDLYHTVQKLKRIIEEELYLNYSKEMEGVT